MEANKLTEIVDLYHKEMKTINQQKSALDICESKCFNRFLDRSSEVHNQYCKKDYKWQELRKEEQSPTLPKTTLSMQSYVTKDLNPVEIYKYAAD